MTECTLGYPAHALVNAHLPEQAAVAPRLLYHFCERRPHDQLDDHNQRHDPVVMYISVIMLRIISFLDFKRFGRRDAEIAIPPCSPHTAQTPDIRRFTTIQKRHVATLF